MSTLVRRRVHTPASRTRATRSVAGRAVSLLAVTSLAAGLASLADRNGLMLGAIVLGALLTIIVVMLGVRANLRDAQLEQVRAALLPVIGDPSTIRARRWVGWFQIGYPRRLVIAYAPGVRDDSIEWREALMSAVDRRLQVQSTLVKLHPRSCTVTLRLEPLPDPKRTPPEVDRARLVVFELFKPRPQFEYSLDEAGLKTVTVRHEMRTRVAIRSQRMRVEQAFNANLPERWRAKWDLTKDVVIFDRRPTFPKVIPHQAQVLSDEVRSLIPIAIDEDGHVIYWNLRGSGPHLIVVGRTGKGKTVAILGAVMEFARRGWPVWLLDPKRIEFMAMRGWPNVQIVATQVVDMIVTIKAAHDLMEERYAAIEAGADEADFEPLLVVLDEFRNFHRLVTAWWVATIKGRGMPTQCPVFEWIAAIAEKGRSAMIHLVIGTQRPDADFMTGSMRDNFDSRLSLGPLSPQGAQMMWDSPHLGVAIPRKARGRGTAINESDAVVEVQVPWTPDPRRAARDGNRADLRILDELRPSTCDHRSLRTHLAEDIELVEERESRWQVVLAGALVESSGAQSPSRLVIGDADIADADAAVTALGEPQHEPDAGTDWVTDASTAEESGFEGYAAEQDATAGHVQVGDLVVVDPDLEVWAVVEAAEPDFADDSQVMISWRDDDDGYGTLSVSADEYLRIRRPEDETS